MKRIVAIALVCVLGLFAAGLGGCGGSGSGAKSSLPSLEVLGSTPQEVSKALSGYPTVDDYSWVYYFSDETCKSNYESNGNIPALTEDQWIVGVSEQYYGSVGIRVFVAPAKSDSAEDVAEALLSLYPDTEYIYYDESPYNSGGALVEGYYIHIPSGYDPDYFTYDVYEKGQVTKSELKNQFGDSSDYTYEQ